MLKEITWHHVATLVGDIHLAHKQPISRNETSWYNRMGDYLNQLATIADNKPILCTGDVFDRWNSPPQLVAFAINHLPPMYSVPGQHDLPNHDYRQQYRSAYGCLVAAGIIKPLDAEAPVRLKVSGLFSLPDLCVYGFPWGFPIQPRPRIDNRIPAAHIAILHKYCYQQKNRKTHYPGAPEENQVRHYSEKLVGYDIAAFGDNHKHFQAKTKHGTHIWNGGAFMARHNDEREFVPRVGRVLLGVDSAGHVPGAIKVAPCELNVGNDMWVEYATEKTTSNDMQLDGFLEQLKGMHEGGIDFRAAMERKLETWGSAHEVARKMILGAMDEFK